MGGIKTLRKLQFGHESPKGTAVAATAIWRGMGVLDDQREVVFVEEDVGIIGGVDRTYISKKLAALTLEETPATFEQLPYIFQMGIDNETPVVDGSGTGYVSTYVFPTTTKTDIEVFTIEGGDDQQAEEMEYSFVKSFSLSGVGGEAVMLSAELEARQADKTTFTGALALVEVEDILFSKGKLYVDTVAAAIGTTQKSNTFLEMSLEVVTGWIAKWTADGEIYFSYAKLTVPEIILNITFEHDATSVDEKENWRDEVPRQVRVEFEGSDLTTADTYTYKTLTLDMAGKWERFDPLGEQDGNDIYAGSFRARYNATAALFAEFVVVNEDVTLP